ncbi:hypothetical protein [Pelosinus sp. IPA-1]|uniref:hypothetical protein n=1 Tax=Pelosinus sp. IPA-1 TaxID=3029569 RepID=UPI002436194B|nr:hypothetical protein [Pelosinus sp. IPA-1]GMB00400.1 hypothetical protein PIPA1_31990 [Pelosinus sp. IPA-1]
MNQDQEKALNDLLGQTLEKKCTKCDNILRFDVLAVFMGGETLVCSKCSTENHASTDKNALENYLSLFPDKNNLS